MENKITSYFAKDKVVSILESQISESDSEVIVSEIESHLQKLEEILSTQNKTVVISRKKSKVEWKIK